MTRPAPPAVDPAAGPLSSPDFLTELFHSPLDGGYADAAARRAEAGPLRPAARRVGVAMRTVALVATGLLLTVAYQQTIAAQPEASKVKAGLVSDVQARQAETDAQQQEADRLRETAARLRDALVGTNADALDQLEARTGLGRVTGGGVSVRLSDGPVPLDPVTGKPLDKDQGRVLDFDVQAITNELWRDGAEAVAINGQRLTASSTIRLAGSAILVDLVPLTQPYVIEAIGPSSMADALAGSQVGDFYHYMSTTYGMHFTIDGADDLTLPAAADPQLRMAHVIRPSSPPSSFGPHTPVSPTPSGGH